MNTITRRAVRLSAGLALAAAATIGVLAPAQAATTLEPAATVSTHAVSPKDTGSTGVTMIIVNDTGADLFCQGATSNGTFDEGALPVLHDRDQDTVSVHGTSIGGTQLQVVYDSVIDGQEIASAAALSASVPLAGSDSASAFSCAGYTITVDKPSGFHPTVTYVIR